MAVAVVQFAFFGVSEYCVSFAALLEFFFRVRIVRIAVGMVLHCKLAVGALNLLISRPTLHTQYFVVISFYARQGSLFSTFRLLYFESASRVSRHFYHGGTQQPVFQFIPALQFFQYLVVIDILGIDHFDCLVIPRVELLAFSRDRFHSEL